MAKQRNKHKQTMACGSKLVIVTQDDEYEIEAVAPAPATPPPPDYGISYVAPSLLQYIGVVESDADLDLVTLLEEAGGVNIEQLGERDDVELRFMVMENGDG
jgi:hypothetical protein